MDAAQFRSLPFPSRGYGLGIIGESVTLGNQRDPFCAPVALAAGVVAGGGARGDSRVSAAGSRAEVA
jgi:hypothetical protein